MIAGAFSGLEIGGVAGGRRAFAPPAPPALPQTKPGLLGWWDCSQSGVVDYVPGPDNKVTAWRPRAGAYTFVPDPGDDAHRPAVAGLDGSRVTGVYFDGGSNSLACHPLAAAMSGNGQTFSWYLALQIGALDGNRVLMSASGVHNGHETYWHWLENGGGIGFISANDAGQGGGGIGGYVYPNELAAWSFLFRGDAGFVRANGAGQLYAGVPGGPMSFESFRLGAAANGSACCNAIVFEAIVYDAFHDDPDRIDVESYLRAKWGTG